MSNNNNAIPSPEEWLEDYDPDLKKWIKDGGHTTLYDLKNMLTSYAAHVAALVHRNTRHLAGEVVVSYDGDNTIDEVRSNMHSDIINIPLRAVYPAPAGEEKQMMTIDVVCQACKTEYCINVPTTIGDFSTECPECGIDVYVYIDSIVEETPGGENITDLPAEEINRLVDHITDVIIEDEQNRESYETD